MEKVLDTFPKINDHQKMITYFGGVKEGCSLNKGSFAEEQLRIYLRDSELGTSKLPLLKISTLIKKQKNVLLTPFHTILPLIR